MKKRSKMPSRILALLMAALMAVTSAPITAFAAEPSEPTIQSTSSIIDDPVSGTTGSGWDDIDGGSSSPETTPETDENKPVTPPEGEVTPPEEEGDKEPSSKPEGETEGESSSTPEVEGENPEKPVTPPEGGETPGKPVVPPAEGENAEGDGTTTPLPEGEVPLTPLEPAAPATPAINGTELPWAANFAAYAEATMAMSAPYIAGDAGGGKVTFTHYGWGVPGGDGTNSIWMGSAPNGDGYYFADVYRSTYDGADSFCGEFNGKMPGGNYTRGEEGTNEQIKKIIASYEASGKSKGDYIAAQALIWAELKNTTVTHWGTSGANQNLLDPGADTSKIKYWIYHNTDAPHTQDLIVYVTDIIPEDPYALKIIKKNEDGSAVLSGATFTVTGPGGFKKEGLKTNNKGEIMVYMDKTGEFVCTETAPPPGYKLATPNTQTVQVTEKNTLQNPAVVEFRNPKGDNPGGGGDITTETETEVHQSKKYEYSDAIGQITIRKEDQDGRPLSGAQFKVTLEFSNGKTEVHEGIEVDGGSKLFTWTHPQDNHDPVKVTVQETKPPLHYELDPTPKTATVHPTYTRVTHVETWTVTITTTTATVMGPDGPEEITSTATSKSDPQVEEFSDFVEGDREIAVTFVNTRNTGDIIVTKRDANTGEVLAGAVVHLKGADLGGVDQGASSIDRTLTTGDDGTARFENLPAGTYTVQEVQPPAGYTLNDQIQTVPLQSGDVVDIEIRNYKKDGLFIRKVDQDGKPLAGAVFELRRGSGEVLIREVTNENGLIFRGNLTTDTYIIEEIQAPTGYLLDENPIQSIYISTADDNKEYTVTFVNKKKPGIDVIKVDGNDSTVKLEGAVFRITDTITNQYWDIETGEDGVAHLENLELGRAYIVEEIQAPAGYENSGYRKEIVLQECRVHTVEVQNFKNPSLIIEKRDVDTMKLLPGAQFRIEKASGELIGTYTTDEDGKIEITELDGLTEGTIYITEIKAPDGYILDTTRHSVNLKAGQGTTVALTNTSRPGLEIVKKDSLTGKPVAGARFNIKHLLNDSGEKDLGDYTTSANGTFFIPDLTPGRYICTEVQAAEGYILDSTPRIIEVEGGKLNIVEVFNTPYSDLRIVKIDAETRQVLEGAVFKIFDKDRLEIGTYTTNAQGEIFRGSLPAGVYYIQEQKAPSGFLLDNTVKMVELIGGKTTTVEIKNQPLGTLRIKKVDADTGAPLYGATFNLYDKRNNLLGEYTTDQNGMIVFGSSLQSGTYKLKETKAPEGYVLDETIHTIKVKSGETTEIVIKNQLQVGKIQIVKISSKNSDVTGDKKGDGLKGAIFEIYDENLKMVDKIETDNRGIATSKDLPLGKYVVKEVKAPKYYFTDGKPFYAEIKVHNDLIRFRVENTPVDLDVTVEKRGVAETMSGEVIRYTFSDIANKSNCELDDFYWRDELPTDAVRIQSLNTGTWNERGTYDLYIRTNKKSGWRCIESNLHTNVEYTIDMTPDALDLASNEYVTDFKIEFGTVKSGFTSEKDPFIKVKVLDDLSAGYRFTNRTDVGGRRGHEWVYDRDSWITVVYKGKNDGSGKPNKGKLPQTGGPNFFEQYPEYLKYIED